jgi:hypothetical protein
MEVEARETALGLPKCTQSKEISQSSKVACEDSQVGCCHLPHITPLEMQIFHPNPPTLDLIVNPEGAHIDSDLGS